jgi:hypothetical protein
VIGKVGLNVPPWFPLRLLTGDLHNYVVPLSYELLLFLRELRTAQRLKEYLAYRYCALRACSTSKPSGPSTLLLSFPNCHLRETLRLTPATLRACHSARLNESYNLRASSGIARILHLDSDRHVSYIVQSGGNLFTCTTRSKAPERRAESPATSDSGLSRRSRAIAAPRPIPLEMISYNSC